MSLPSRAASSEGALTTLRRCVAPNRPDQRAVLPHDVAEPTETTRYGGGGGATGDGSDPPDGRSQAVAGPGPRQDRDGPGRPAASSHDPAANWAKIACPLRSSLEACPRCA